MFNNTGRLLVISAIAIVSLAGFFRVISNPHTVAFTAEDRIQYVEEKEYWVERISKKGGHKAYVEFGASVAELSARKQHMAAHVFGEALYDMEGVEGVSVCDASFMMGCFHALFGTAAQILGTDALVSELAAKCSEGPRGLQRLCLHGIGHGVLGSMGYTSSDLTKALALCEKVPSAGNLTTGCWGGVLMEYNVRTLVSLEEPERPFSRDDAYTPCDDLEKKYAEACMFWQPTWWHIVFSHEGDDATAFARIGALCREHPKPELAEACFRGAGFRATWTSGYSALTIAGLCAAVSDDVPGRLACWQSARLELNPSSIGDAASRVCQGLSAKASDDCMSRMRR